VDGGECDCEEFSSPDNPDKPLACAECGHGRSKHTNKGNDSTGNDSTGKKKSVLQVFQGITNKKPFPTSLEQARTGMQQGFLAKSMSTAGTSTGKSTRRGKAKVRPSIISFA
jgi:hypothetical protein